MICLIEIKYNFNSLFTKKIKRICMEIDPTPKDELAAVCAISFRTDSNRVTEYIWMTKRKLTEHKIHIKFCCQSTALLYLSFSLNIKIDRLEIAQNYSQIIIKWDGDYFILFFPWWKYFLLA